MILENDKGNIKKIKKFSFRIKEIYRYKPKNYFTTKIKKTLVERDHYLKILTKET